MQKVRSRLVSFRVTDDEFEQLNSGIDRNGFRSLSDFARKMLLRAAQADERSLADQMTAVQGRLQVLEDSMARLFHALGPAPDVSVCEK